MILVDLEDLAKGYQSLLDNRLVVVIDQQIDTKETRIPVVMHATRRPYKIEDIDSEAIEISFGSYICCDQNVYQENINLLSKLLGYKKFTFESKGRTYKAFSFLDFDRPFGDPVVDSGKFMRTITLTGSVMISGQTGALLSNEIETYITFNKDKPNELTGKLEVLQAVDTLTTVPETAQMSNEITGKSFNSTQAQTKEYSVLLLNDEISKRLYKAVKGIEPFELNEKICVEEFLTILGDRLSSNKDCVLNSLQLERSAGSFLVLKITLNERMRIEDLDEEDVE